VRPDLLLTSSAVPVLGFSGGSGVTPSFRWPERAGHHGSPGGLLCADRDRASVIFDAVLDDLVARYPDRLSVLRHIDDERGLLEPAAVLDFVGAGHRRRLLRLRAEGFMSVVKSGSARPGAVFIEDFDATPQNPAAAPPAARRPNRPAAPSPSTLTARRPRCPRRDNETLLESARRAG